jgi:hypothetical protein
MSQPAIRVVDLSKEYHIGLKRKSGRTLREAIVDAAKGPFRRAAKLLRGQAGLSKTCHLRFRTATSLASSDEMAQGKVRS